MIGDEIVNVNGRRLRGLSMPEAKAILRSCSKKDVDIVVTRNVSHPAGITQPLTELLQPGGEAQQPLSLLAHHDEHDLINLSSMPLRPGGELEDDDGGDAEDEEEFE